MTTNIQRTRTGPPAPAGTPRSTPAERAVVLAGFAAAALYTAVSAALGFGLETAGAAWLAAVLWTITASLACALARGIRRRDWSAFTGYRLPTAATSGSTGRHRRGPMPGSRSPRSTSA